MVIGNYNKTMENKKIFQPNEIVVFHDGSIKVRVISMHDDLYLFKGEVIESESSDIPIGTIKRNFYRHKFYPEK